MDEATVYEYARYHMMDILAGDRETAINEYLTDEAKNQAGPVFEAIPKKVEESGITEMLQEGDRWLVNFNYTGGDVEVFVESVWEEREGKPMITGIRLTQ